MSALSAGTAVPYRRTFWRLLSFLRPYRRGLIISIFLAIGSQLCQIALVWVTGKNVIDGALEGHNSQQLWFYVGAVVVLGVASAGLMSARRLISGKQALEVGCGRGGGSAFVFERFQPSSLTGVDLAGTAIDRCRRSHGRPRFGPR